MPKGHPGEKSWWRPLPAELRPTYTRPPLIGWRLFRRVLFIVPAAVLGLMVGFTNDCPVNAAAISLFPLSIGLVSFFILRGPYRWSEIWDSGDSLAGKSWIYISLAPYATAFALPVIVVCIVRYLLGERSCS